MRQPLSDRLRDPAGSQAPGPNPSARASAASTCAARRSAGAAGGTRSARVSILRSPACSTAATTRPARARGGGFGCPCDDARFDFVILTSVPTQLLEAEAAHHLPGTARAPGRGGRALMTPFTPDDASRAAIADGRAGLPVLGRDAHMAVVAEDAPEAAVAVDAGSMRERPTAHGAAEVIMRHGACGGRDDGRGPGDLAVAEAPA